MGTAVIVDAVRTGVARGKPGVGKLANWHPVDLAGEVLRTLVSRNDLDPALVEDVFMGCVSQVGEQSANVARWAVLAAGFPDSVPATTIDRQCGSSQQAVHFAAQAVMAGAYDIVIAAGVESMSRVTMGSPFTNGPGEPFGPRVMARYSGEGALMSQGISADMISDKWGLTREDLDRFSVESHQRAARAREEGRFEREILPVAVKDADGNETEERFDFDEGIRPATTLETLSALKPAFDPKGRITAGNSSQISDGAAAVLVMTEEKANALGLRPRARFHTFAMAANDPVLMLTGPIPATEQALRRSGLSIDDIDVVEINEAFASVVLAWAREFQPDMEKVNPNGGAIALGHPLGASGARLMTTMLHELERTGGRYGLQTMCEGGGMANATIIERL